MKFSELVEIVGDEPLFETGLLVAGDVDFAALRKQLSRWTAASKLFQLRRGLYALAPPFQKIKPHPFVVANHLVQGSYVSCQSALAYYGMIPEHAPVVVSVTNARPGRWDTPLGSFLFRHIKKDLLNGYRLVQLGGRQRAFVASPEKALLDLLYLQPGADDSGYLRELRLQNLHTLDTDKLRRMASATERPKLMRAAKTIAGLASSENLEYEPL
ncbi:MAG: hypothetical protein KDH89_07960 [Anaerolineae bacterium]|nr:hypothetical protein [Anaerolineae bacterium]